MLRLGSTHSVAHAITPIHRRIRVCEAETLPKYFFAFRPIEFALNLKRSAQLMAMSGPSKGEKTSLRRIPGLCPKK